MHFSAIKLFIHSIVNAAHGGVEFLCNFAQFNLLKTVGHFIYQRREIMSFLCYSAINILSCEMCNHENGFNKILCISFFLTYEESIQLYAIYWLLF